MPKKKVTKAPAARKPEARRSPAKAAGKAPARKPTSGRSAAALTLAREPRDAALRKPSPTAARSVPRAAPERLAGGKAGRLRPTGAGQPVVDARPARAPKTPTRKIPAGELAKIRELLAHKKRALSSHLQTELSELEKPEKRHRADLEEIASDTHDTDSLCEIMDIEATQIDQIDMALSKIDNGTYGVCEDCGGEIPLARLEALPFASQCIECKRKAEISGRIVAPPDPAAFL